MSVTLTDPRTALNEILAAVTAITLPASYDATEPAAFDKVKLFDLDDLAVAMEELFAYSNRIALIALDSIEHGRSVSGRNIRLERSLGLTIIVSDRRFSDRQKAMVGDAVTPGALYLQTLLVDALSGELASGAVVIPGTGRLVSVTNEKRVNETGRIAFTQDFQVHIAWDAVSLSRKAMVAPAD